MTSELAIELICSGEGVVCGLREVDRIGAG